MQQLAVAEASAKVPELLKVTEEAKSVAQAKGLHTAKTTQMDSPQAEMGHPELRLEEAVRARADIVALRKLFPMTEWSNVMDGEEEKIDLYASTRKKFWIAGGIFASATLVLVIVAPEVAMAFGVIGGFLAVKVYARGRKMKYW